MLNKKRKTLLTSIIGAVLLVSLSNYDMNIDNEVEADNQVEIEKVSHEETKETEVNIKDEDTEDELLDNDVEDNSAEEDELEVSDSVAVSTDTEQSANTEQEEDDTTVVFPKNNSTSSSVISESPAPDSEENNEVKKEEYDDEAGSTEITSSGNSSVVTPADVEEDVTNDSKPVSVQLLSNGQPVGSLIYGEKFSYYGNRDNLQFLRASGDLLDVYVGDTYYLDENYEDASGIDREIIATSSNGMAIVNTTEDNGYIVHMLYPK